MRPIKPLLLLAIVALLPAFVFGQAQISRTYFQNDYTDTTFSDNVQVTAFGGNVVADQQGGSLNLVLPPRQYHNFYNSKLKAGKTLDLRNNAVLAFKLKSNKALVIQVRLADTSGTGTGDVYTSNINPPADSAWHNYSVDLSARLISQGVNRRLINSITFFNYTNGAVGGKVSIDSLRLGAFPNASSVLTKTSWENDFPGLILNDTNQTTGGDGGVTLSQNNQLNAVLNNWPTYRKLYESVLLAGKTVDLRNDAIVSFKLKSDIALTLQFRLSDTSQVSTGDIYSSNINIPGDNQVRTYSIDLAARLDQQRVNRQVINRFILFNYTNGSISGNVVMDSLRIGKVPSGASILTPKAFANNFTGTVLNDTNQTTGADGGASLSQNNGIKVRLENFRTYRKPLEITFRKPKLVNIFNDANLYVTVGSTTPLNLQFRVSDTSGTSTGDHYSTTVGIPGDGVKRRYRIDFAGRIATQNLKAKLINRLSVFSYGADSANGVVTFDSLVLGKEPCGSSEITPTYWINRFPCEVINDDNQQTSSDGSIALTQNNELIANFRNARDYQKIQFQLRNNADAIDISGAGAAKFRVDISTNSSLGLQFRLEDINGLSTGDTYLTNQLVPGDSTYATYIIDFTTRLAVPALSAFRKDKVVGVTIWNLSGAQGLDTAVSAKVKLDNFSLGNSPITSVKASFNKQSVFTYPNPAGNSVKIAGLPSALNSYKVEVNDLKGSNFRVDQTSDNELNTSNLPSGLYVIKLTGANQNYQLKIVKE